jgi:hypothetical protein
MPDLACHVVVTPKPISGRRVQERRWLSHPGRQHQSASGWGAQLREAAAPDARPPTVAAGPLAAVDENARTARDIAAGCTAWYLSAMGEAYARSLSGQGYAAQVQAIIAVLLPPGMPWHNIEATLQAAAPSARQ